MSSVRENLSLSDDVITYASVEGSVPSVFGKIIFHQVINLKNPNLLFLDFLDKCT